MRSWAAQLLLAVIPLAAWCNGFPSLRDVGSTRGASAIDTKLRNSVGQHLCKQMLPPQTDAPWLSRVSTCLCCGGGYAFTDRGNNTNVVRLQAADHAAEEMDDKAQASTEEAHSHRPEIETMSGDIVGALSEILSMLSISCFGQNKNPKIRDIVALDEHLPTLCQSIFEELGTQNREATYQNALHNDLDDASVRVQVSSVHENSFNLVHFVNRIRGRGQVSPNPRFTITLERKGKVIEHRYPDLVVQTLGDGEKAVLEIKAVKTLTKIHFQQLEYYMHALGIRRGYLVNFPHEPGFPHVVEDDTNGAAAFRQTLIWGSQTVAVDPPSRWHSTWNTDGAAARPQIIRFESLDREINEMKTARSETWSNLLLPSTEVPSHDLSDSMIALGWTDTNATSTVATGIKPSHRGTEDRPSVGYKNPSKDLASLPDYTFDFGTHKGELLSRVIVDDPQYVHWICRKQIYDGSGIFAPRPNLRLALSARG